MRVLPPQDPDGVRRLLACADLFVLPSHAEGISNALLEAMAAGVAPAASDIPGNREVVAPLGADLLFDPAAPPAIAGVLARLLAAPGRRAAAGSAARERAVDAYGLEAAGERYLSLVREALAAGPGAPSSRKSPR